jgi:hypothetical protein
MVLGARWDSDPTFRSMFHRFDAVIVALLAAGLAWFVWTRWRERARHKAKWPLNVPPHRPFRQTLLLSTVVIAVTALAAVVLWAATSGLWLVVHQGLH